MSESLFDVVEERERFLIVEEEEEEEAVTTRGRDKRRTRPTPGDADV